MRPLTSTSEHSFHVVCFDDQAALTNHLAKTLRDALSAEHAGERAIMLSGGSTPFPAYNLVAEAPPDLLGDVHLFFSDERHVPLDHAKSNYRGTRPLIDGLRLPTDRVHAIQPDLPLRKCAIDYHERLRDLLENGVTLPLGILGMGSDGHTAGLFSQDDLRRNPVDLATWVQRPDGMAGITVTPRLLRRVDTLVFVVSGEGKSKRLSDLIKRPHSLIAGQVVKGHPAVEIWCDEAAWPG